jgi:hypothetical protein
MIVVVYKKSKNAVKKYMTVFENEQTPDRIINLNARKPLLSNSYVIEDIGVGESFIEYYKQKHKVKRYETA